MASPTNLQEETTPVFDARNLELESIDFFVRLMSMLGMPRSVGEIYGVLYFPKILCPWIRIASRLGISIGSAQARALHPSIPESCSYCLRGGDRRDHCIAETEFRRLFSNFIKDEIMPHLDSAKDRISRMEKSFQTTPRRRMNFMQFALKNSDGLRRQADACFLLLPAC